MTTVLRGEWGFKGTVTSDGYVNTGYYNNTLEELVAGMDYSCCDSNGANAQRILNAIEGGDGNILQHMRQAAKRNLYVMTHTARMNGLGNGASVIAIVPAWEMAVFAANIVIGALFVVCLAPVSYTHLDVYKRQGQADAVLSTVEALAGEHRVQHLVAGLVLSFIGADLRLHLIQVRLPLLRVRLCPEHHDLVLQVMIFPVDEVDAVSGHLILLILLLQHVLNRLQLSQHPQLTALKMMGVQDS